MEQACGGVHNKPIKINVQTTRKLLKASYENLEFKDEDDNDERANLAILEHLSNNWLIPTLLPNTPKISPRSSLCAKTAPSPTAGDLPFGWSVIVSPINVTPVFSATGPNPN